MSKKIIAIFTIITVLFVCVFAACENSNENELYIDEKEYDFVTDENGERVLDKNGEFVVYVEDEKGKHVTNESGEKVTKAQPFEALEQDGVLEHYGYKVTLPEGWKATKTSGKFENKEAEQTVEINVVKSLYEEFTGKAYYLYEQSKESGLDVSWDDEVDLGEAFENACCLTYKSEGKVAFIYIFENSENTYQIIFMSPDSKTAKKDCLEFCKAIEFKPYQYFEGLTSATTTQTTMASTDK